MPDRIARFGEAKEKPRGAGRGVWSFQKGHRFKPGNDEIFNWMMPLARIARAIRPLPARGER